MELDNLKNSWKVLDENLDKKEIVSNEQIKTIIMGKIKPVFEKKAKREFIFFVLLAAVGMPYTLYELHATSIYNNLYVTFFWIFLWYQAIKKYITEKKVRIENFSPADLLKKIREDKLIYIRGLIFSISILIIFSLFATNGFSNHFEWLLVLGIMILVFFILTIREYRYYKFTVKNLEEIEDMDEV